MKRFIITYKTTNHFNNVVVVKAKNIYLAENVEFYKLINLKTAEIITIRELYNPLLDPKLFVTDYELSMLENGIHSRINYYDIPLERFNAIAQIYGDRFMTKKEYNEQRQ